MDPELLMPPLDARLAALRGRSSSYFVPAHACVPLPTILKHDFHRMRLLNGRDQLSRTILSDGKMFAFSPVFTRLFPVRHLRSQRISQNTTVEIEEGQKLDGSHIDRKRSAEVPSRLTVFPQGNFHRDVENKCLRNRLNSCGTCHSNDQVEYFFSRYRN